MTHINTLPNEILINIFSYLSTTELRNGPSEVCKKWKNITALRALTIQCQKDLVQLAEQNSFKSLTSLEVTTHIDFINRFIWGIGTLCLALRELTIHNCNPLQEVHIEFIAKQFKNLEHIDVFLSSGFIENYFIEYMKDVKSIVLNNRILNNHLSKIAQECADLECLNMYGYVEFYPIKELNILLIVRFATLTELTLRCSEVSEKTCILISKCYNLKTLKMYSCWLIRMQALTLLTNLRKLHTLHLTGLKLINKKNLLQFLYCCDMNIVELNLSSSEFDDLHARELVKIFPNLTTLELWKCKYLSEKGVTYLANNLNRLKTLDLTIKLSSEAIFNISLTNLINLRILVDDETRGLVDRINTLSILDCSARYKGRYFRGTSEGFRANLFYYSLRNKVLQPIKCESEIKVEDMFPDL